MASFAAPAVGVLGSVVGGLLGSDAAKKAAEIQARFGTLNAQGITQTGQVNTQRISDMYNRATGRYSSYDPYTTAGNQGMWQLQDLLGLGDPTKGSAKFGTMAQDIPLNLPGATNLTGLDLKGYKFDPSQAAVDPSLAFRLSEGNKAIERSAAAKGGLLGGGTAKALEQYSQGLASEEYQNMFNRGLTEYGTGVNAATQNWQTGNTAAMENWQTGVQNALDTFSAANTNRQNLYSKMMGLTGLGANLTQDQARSLASMDVGFGQQAGAQDWATTMAANDAWSQVANAQAGGRMGGANAWTNALQGITGAVGGASNMASLSKLLGMQGQGGSGGFGDIGSMFAPSAGYSGIPGGQAFGSFAPAYSAPFDFSSASFPTSMNW
jgi:hypothetical protein